MANTINKFAGLEVSGPATWFENLLQRLCLAAYSELVQTVAIAAGVITVDLYNGNHVQVTVGANITSFAITHFAVTGRISPVIFYFVGNGTGYTQTWTVNGKAVKWPGATAPVLTITSGKVDKVILYTRDGDTSWFGEVAAQNS